MNASVVPVIKEEPDKLTVATVRPRDRSNSNSSNRSKSQLPRGVGDTSQGEKRWSGVFVPTFYSYLGALRDPWHAEAAPSLKALQQIWDTVYPDKLHVIESVHDVVYTIVSCVHISEARLTGASPDTTEILRMAKQVFGDGTSVSSVLFQGAEMGGQ